MHAYVGLQSGFYDGILVFNNSHYIILTSSLNDGTRQLHVSLSGLPRSLDQSRLYNGYRFLMTFSFLKESFLCNLQRLTARDAENVIYLLLYNYFV